jgi:hypothetical protein
MKKILTSSLIAAAFLASGWQASANQLLIANGTYSFTETDGLGYGTTGSTISFANDQPTAWDIHIADPTYPTQLNDTYTTHNSVISAGLYGGVLGTDAFAYYLKADTVNVDGDPSGSISWNVNGNHIYDNPVWAQPLDPTGIWTQIPDSSGTMQLFACALMALGICKFFSSPSRSQC